MDELEDINLPWQVSVLILALVAVFVGGLVLVGLLV
jgi:hypothetical protein